MFTASLAAGSTAGGCFISYIMFFMNSWRMPSMRFCMIIVFIWYARQKASTSTSTVLPTSLPAHRACYFAGFYGYAERHGLEVQRVG